MKFRRFFIILLVQLLLGIKFLFIGVFYKFVYLAEDRINILDKLDVWFKLIMSSSLAVFIFDQLGGWFCDNKQFATFVSAAVIINAGIGMYRHIKGGTFVWEMFFRKTGLMIFTVILSYMLLAR